MTYQSSKEVSRRKFLRYLVGGIAGLITTAMAYPLAGYLLSPVWKKQQRLTTPITRTSEIPIGVPTFIRYEERVPDAWVRVTESKGAWVVTKDGKNFVLFDPHCTHLNCPFYWDSQRQVFQCPCHDGQFNIDGDVLTGPPPRPLDKLEFIIERDEIEVTGNIIRSAG